MLPHLFDNMFSKISSLRSLFDNVRSSSNYRSAFAKSVFGSSSIVCMGPKVYASPRNVVSLPNLHAFKKEQKYFIINS